MSHRRLVCWAVAWAPSRLHCWLTITWCHLCRVKLETALVAAAAVIAAFQQQQQLLSAGHAPAPCYYSSNANLDKYLPQTFNKPFAINSSAGSASFGHQQYLAAAAVLMKCFVVRSNVTLHVPVQVVVPKQARVDHLASKFLDSNMAKRFLFGHCACVVQGRESCQLCWEMLLCFTTWPMSLVLALQIACTNWYMQSVKGSREVSSKQQGGSRDVNTLSMLCQKT